MAPNSRLGDYGSVIRGVTFNAEKDFRPHGFLGSIELLRSNNIQTNSLFLDNTYNLSIDKVEQKQILVEGDLLICMANGSKDLVGKSAYVDKQISGKYTFGSFMGAFRPNNSETGLFFRYILQSSEFRNHINLILAGSSINNLTPSLIEDYSFKIPKTVDEQKAIAKALSDIDELISTLNTEYSKLLNFKDALCQDLVTAKRRLPNYSGDWSITSLGDVLDYEQPTAYLVDTTEHLEQGNVPVLTAGKSFILGYSDDLIGVYNNTPTILFDDFTTDSKYVDFSFKVKSSACKMLSLKDSKNNLLFIYTLMQYLPFAPYDHKRYWISEYSKIEISLPDYNEQYAIADVIKNLNSKIEILRASILKYECIKQGMMNDLLTGKVRLV